MNKNFIISLFVAVLIISSVFGGSVFYYQSGDPCDQFGSNIYLTDCNDYQDPVMNGYCKGCKLKKFIPSCDKRPEIQQLCDEAVRAIQECGNIDNINDPTQWNTDCLKKALRKIQAYQDAVSKYDYLFASAQGSCTESDAARQAKSYKIIAGDMTSECLNGWESFYPGVRNCLYTVETQCMCEQPNPWCLEILGKECDVCTFKETGLRSNEGCKMCDFSEVPWCGFSDTPEPVIFGQLYYSCYNSCEDQFVHPNDPSKAGNNPIIDRGCSAGQKCCLQGSNEPSTVTQPAPTDSSDCVKFDDNPGDTYYYGCYQEGTPNCGLEGYEQCTGDYCAYKQFFNTGIPCGTGYYCYKYGVPADGTFVPNCGSGGTTSTLFNGGDCKTSTGMTDYGTCGGGGWECTTGQCCGWQTSGECDCNCNGVPGTVSEGQWCCSAPSQQIVGSSTTCGGENQAPVNGACCSGYTLCSDGTCQATCPVSNPSNSGTPQELPLCEGFSGWFKCTFTTPTDCSCG